MRLVCSGIFFEWFLRFWECFFEEDYSGCEDYCGGDDPGDWESVFFDIVFFDVGDPGFGDRFCCEENSDGVVDEVGEHGEEN